jgi:hypothetical protein
MGYPMSDTTTPSAAAAPWYTSKVQITQIATILSALIAISPKLGTLLGLPTPGAVEAAVEAVFGGIAVVAPIIGSIFRAKSPLQPLTLTQAGADAHPATIAAEVAAAPPRVVLPDPVTTHVAPIPGKPWGTS